MYLVTIFRIDSEIKIQDVFSQDIEVRALKTFENYADAETYLFNIKNMALMRNFPFAIIQLFKKSNILQVVEQKLYMLDENNMKYNFFDDISILTLATRKKLHTFDEKVELSC